MIPVFNSAELLKKTLESVLCQDLGPGEMEVEVLDNCSTKDDPGKVVRELGRGRVGYFRQSTNVGASENFNSCIRRARGQWVHILHADDIVLPGFFLQARKAIRTQPDISAVIFRVVYMDEAGAWRHLAELEAPTPQILDKSFVERQLTSQRIQSVGMIVRRAAYEELGGFRPDLPYCDDWEMWNRIIVRKRVFYVPELLACFRVHGEAATASHVRTGKNVIDERRCIKMSTSDLPPERARNVYRAAMRAAIIRALRHMQQLKKAGDKKAVRSQMRQIFYCYLAMERKTFSRSQLFSRSDRRSVASQFAPVGTASLPPGTDTCVEGILRRRSPG